MALIFLPGVRIFGEFPSFPGDAERVDRGVEGEIMVQSKLIETQLEQKIVNIVLMSSGRVTFPEEMRRHRAWLDIERKHGADGLPPSLAMEEDAPQERQRVERDTR
jgi:hypothetical protein